MHQSTLWSHFVSVRIWEASCKLPPKAGKTTGWRAEGSAGKPVRPPCVSISLTLQCHHTSNPNLCPQLLPHSFCFSNPHAQMGFGCDRETRGRKKKKKAVARKSPLPCYYTHQTSLIRQQQNFINRMDIMEWACYKWALSGPYSATKWVFSVQCSHLRHHA